MAQQPGQTAYSIIDAKSIRLFMPSIFPAVEAPTIAELAAKLGLDPAALTRTVDEFNAAVRPGAFDHTQLDDCKTARTEAAEAHWARKIDTPPFYGYPLRPGITFTYLGVRVNEEARMLLEGGKPTANMFAAGEIMAGNVLGKGYLAGIGMTIGAVFGRIAGQGAARMPATEALREADRLMTICNACRYCEGLCAVFPAMEMRRTFADGDLNYLANLCHGCGACYPDCQYSPPHEFNVNVPAALAKVRNDSYARYAWPSLFRRLRAHGLIVTCSPRSALPASSSALSPGAIRRRCGRPMPAISTR